MELGTVSFVLSFILLVLGITGFWVSYHNVDLSVNAFASGLGSYVDEGAFGNIVTVKQMYLNGIGGMFVSFFTVVLSQVIMFVTYLKGLLKRGEQD